MTVIWVTLLFAMLENRLNRQSSAVFHKEFSCEQIFDIPGVRKKLDGKNEIFNIFIMPRRSSI